MEIGSYLRKASKNKQSTMERDLGKRAVKTTQSSDFSYTPDGTPDGTPNSTPYASPRHKSKDKSKSKKTVNKPGGFSLKVDRVAGFQRPSGTSFKH